jgi:hypothetical protein
MAFTATDLRTDRINKVKYEALKDEAGVFGVMVVIQGCW